MGSSESILIINEEINDILKQVKYLPFLGKNVKSLFKEPLEILVPGDETHNKVILKALNRAISIVCKKLNADLKHSNKSDLPSKLNSKVKCKNEIHLLII